MLVPPMFAGVFMEKTVSSVKNYFRVFMLGAVFGKVIELSGLSKSIVSAVIGVLGRERAVLCIVVVCAILTYGGVSLCVVVFCGVSVRGGDVSPGRSSGKRLIPCTMTLSAYGFTMDALPGTPQIQERHSDDLYFDTTTWTAPVLGLVGSAFVFGVGLAYIENRPRAAGKRGKGYSTKGLLNEPEPFKGEGIAQPVDRRRAAGRGRRCELHPDAGLVPRAYSARSMKSHSVAIRSLRRWLG